MATTSAFTTSLITNAIIALILLLLFTWLRGKYLWCYFPRIETWRRYSKGDTTTTAPPLLNNSVSWLAVIFSTTDDEIFVTAGLDALMLIKFYRMSLQFFIGCMVIGVIVLLPVNITGGGGGTGFDSMSMTNVESQDRRLWAHFVANLLFSLLAYYFLYKTSVEYVSWRQRWLLVNHMRETGRSLLVQEVPYISRNEHEFYGFWNRLYPDHVASSILAREYMHLQSHLDDHKTVHAKLVHARALAATSNENPTHRRYLCGPKVESIPYYEGRLTTLSQTLDAEASKDHKILHCGFVTFKDSYTMSLAARADQSIKPNVWLTKVAPEPRDVYWPNLKFRLKDRTVRQALAHFAVFWLIFFWVIPVTFVGSLTTLAALSAALPFLDPVASSSDVVRGLLQGWIPTLVLLLFMALLPRILLEISKQAGIEARSWLSMSVLNYYFLFQVFNVFLVSVIAGSIFDVLQNFIDNPTSIVTLLADSLPKVANFFINYIMLQAFSGFPFLLLQLPRLLLGGWRKRSALTDDEREKAEQPPALDYGTDYPQALLVFMISLAYATIAPLILVFAAIYFFFGGTAHLYNILFVYVQEYETGGLFWPMVFTRCVAAIVIAQLTIIGLFGVKLAPTQATLSIVLPFLSLLFYMYVRKVFKRKSEVLPVEMAVQADAESKLQAKSDVMKGMTSAISTGGLGTEDAAQAGAIAAAMGARKGDGSVSDGQSIVGVSSDNASAVGTGGGGTNSAEKEFETSPYRPPYPLYTHPTLIELWERRRKAEGKSHPQRDELGPVPEYGRRIAGPAGPVLGGSKQHREAMPLENRSPPASPHIAAGPGLKPGELK